MNYLELLQSQQGGFSFSNEIRNEMIEKTIKSDPTSRFKDLKMPEARKTGTTIVGIMFKDGVILGADTRATAGTTVFIKNCKKIEYVAPNIYCAGAGSAADTHFVKQLMKSKLELMRLNTNRESRVSTVISQLQNHLFRYQGHISAYLIVGGYDITGPKLAYVSADGHVSYQPFTALGSGTLPAISVLETKYKDDLTEDEAQKIIIEAISAGINHDLGSGSNVDLVVLKKGETAMHRNIVIGQSRQYFKQIPYQFMEKNTPILKEFSIVFDNVEEKEAEKMEIL